MIALVDRVEKRKVYVNLALLAAGLLLVVFLIAYTRGGFSWFSNAVWSGLSWVKWVWLVVLLGGAGLLQYYLFSLLRYSIVRILVLWLLPLAWLFNNGLVAIQRLFEFTSDETFITGWVPLTDLLGWVLGAVFFPLLVAGGAAVAVVDSASVLFIDVCRVAGVLLDVTGNGFLEILSHVFRFLGNYAGLLFDSFSSDVLTDNLRNRPFWEFSLKGVFRLSNWLFSAGYNLSCIMG